VPDRPGVGARARASTTRNPVPEMTFPTPLTWALTPRTVTPKVVAPMMRLLSTSTGPELRISIPICGLDMVFPEMTVPGANGPTDIPDRGAQRMSLPVRTLLVAPARTTIAVVLSHIWSALMTMPLPPSTRMPMWPLPVAALL
jgi:hypothetical protein